MIVTEIYICAFCNNRMADGFLCVGCQEYKGAVTVEEWLELNSDNPKKRWTEND